jgi:hypothetical protein
MSMRAWTCYGDHPGVDLPISVPKGDNCDVCGASEPSAAFSPPEPEPMQSRERTLHFWLARLTGYPRWVSIGSIDNYAELPRVSRDDFEKIQAVLRGK